MTIQSAERQKPMKKERQSAPVMRMNYFGAKAPMFESSNLVSPSPSDQKKPTKENDGKKKMTGFDSMDSEHLETRAAW
ncbi:hypothetical protein KKE92_00785 [Candidatus Micrarchaeota archaeon]|nr:hypothetical protein [Candidatus Micrarchaeota archaeon]MBU1681522.1 hypothetical protein [Candidatus Micrarchaeota archaeon]